MSSHVSRRHFIGGVTAAAALGTVGVTPQVAEARVRRAAIVGSATRWASIARFNHASTSTTR